MTLTSSSSSRLLCSFLIFSKPMTHCLSRLLTTQNDWNPQANSLSCQTKFVNNKENELNLLDLEHSSQFHHHGPFSSPFTLSKIISFCAKSASLNTGIQLHSTVIKMGFALNLYIQSALIDMYGKSGDMFSAQNLFDGVPDKNVVCWNTLISGYVHVNSPEIAVTQFIKMLRTGIKVSVYSISNILVACSQWVNGELGAQVHCYCLKVGFFCNVVIGTGLIDMYSKCLNIEDSRRVFDEMIDKNVISWTAMVSGYAQYGLPYDALVLIKEMSSLGLRLNHVAYTSLLSSFSSRHFLDCCRQVHCLIIRDGLENDVYIAITLLTVYSKCGCNLKDFQKLYEVLPRWDQISWNAVIAGFCNLGYNEEAMNCFAALRQAGIGLDFFTVASILGAIGNSSSLEGGKQMHALILETGYASDIFVQSGLVSMYARCGMISDSKMVFSSIEEHNVISWNSLLSGCAHHGYGREAVELFEQMRKTEIKPNGTTFLVLLSACSHVGLLDKGLEYFELMQNDALLEPPRVEHYAAIVNLFGRAGYLNEAEAFIYSMPIEPGPSVYKALLSACEVYGNIQIATRLAKRLLQLWPYDPVTYVLLSKVLKMVDKWDDAAGVCKLMSDRGVRKNPGCSWF